MIVVYIILSIIAVLLLLSLIRVGARVEYDESGLTLFVKVCGISVRVFPMKKKERARRVRGEKMEETGPAGKKGGSFELVKELLPVVVDALGGLKRRISIDEIQIDLLWSLSDPAACAVGFGAAHAAIGMIWLLIEQNFHVKEHRVTTAVDFEQGRPTVCILAQATLRLGQLAVWSARSAVRSGKIYRSVSKKQETNMTKQQKEAV